jgi:putative hemolysin
VTVSDWILYGSVLVVAVLFSAFFSGMETGAYVLNRLRLAVRGDRGEHAARLLQAELARPNRWLATLLAGNAIVGYAASWAIGHMLEGIGMDWIGAMLVNVAVLLPILVICGETVPKELFRVHADAWTVAMVPLARAVRWALTACGAVPLLQWMGDVMARRLGLASTEAMDVRQRVVDLLRESHGAVEEHQVTMAGRVLQLARRNTGQMMTPWRRVSVLAEGATPATVRETLRSRRHGRYPVIDASARCVGIASAVDLLVDPVAAPSAVSRPPVFVAPGMPALETLRLLRQSGASLAVVAEGDRPVGVIGLQDLLGQVVGQLPGW